MYPMVLHFSGGEVFLKKTSSPCPLIQAADDHLEQKKNFVETLR
jgi:hypothetical protein